MSTKSVNRACQHSTCHSQSQDLAQMTGTHQLWHAVIEMADKNLTTGMPIDPSILPPICESCVVSKQTKNRIPQVHEGRKATRLLEKVHSDITGPEHMRTPSGELYALNFIDDFSEKNWVYPLRHKHEAAQKFHEWRALVEAETAHKVTTYHTDNGGEFTSQAFEQHLCTTSI